MKTLSKILNKEFDFKAMHLQLTFDKDFWVFDEYQIMINDQSFTYKMGIGHRKLTKYMEHQVKNKRERNVLNRIPKKSVENYRLYINELKRDTVIDKKPCIDDVFYSLVMDSMAMEESFKDWCYNFGYDTDSRKALNIYLKCQDNANKLKKLGVNISETLEKFEDY
jgi:hypothetical protein